MKANIWNLPLDLEEQDYLFCCDVMEHLPEKYLDGALIGMSQRMKKGGLFQICCHDDHHTSNRHGVETHLTVKPPQWWVHLLGYYFAIRNYSETRDGETVIIAVDPIK